MQAHRKVDLVAVVDPRKAGAEVARRVALDLPIAALAAAVAASPNLEVARAQVQVLDQRKAEVHHQPRRKAHKVCQYNHGDRSK